GKASGERAWLLAHDSDELADEAAERFRGFSLRRAAGEPLAYIIGSKEFFGLELQVDGRVLVPRPDTETLVQWSLDLLLAPAMPAAPDILDLGTGSGAIALAIAHSLRAAGRDARALAVDASADALAVARENASRLGLKVDFLESGWLRQVKGRFHLIASNPPYIARADPHLAALVHEPLQALEAGADGLDDIRQIIAQAGPHLHPGGWLLLEHGYDQAAQVRELLLQGGFTQVQSRLDLAGIERCSGGQWAPLAADPAPSGT
ncbi:MAG: peptide chain release factor N(5)-glutamine methyltransferase, partial [Polaromonas sp.]